jgi:hypothetical protein
MICHVSITDWNIKKPLFGVASIGIIVIPNCMKIKSAIHKLLY